MKKHPILLVGLAVLAASTFYAVTQQAPQSAPTTGYTRTIYPAGVLLEDPQTREILSPEGDQSKVAHLNTPELKQEREQAAFAIEHPEESERIREPDPAKFLAQKATALAGLQPDYERMQRPSR